MLIAYLLVAGFLHTHVQKYCSEFTLKNLSVNEKRKQGILEGIRQNLNYNQIAYKMGIHRRALIRDVYTMRRLRDPGLLDAEKAAEAKIDKLRKAASLKRDKKFFNMTGMTLLEKSFQNMVYFYKPELTEILNSEDQVTAIRCLPKSVRRTLLRNKILINMGQFEVSQRACELLLE